MSSPVISVEYKGRVAVLTIDNPKKLGALNRDQYYELAKKMDEIATHDEVFVTVLIGTGRYFSAYVPHLPCSSSPPFSQPHGQLKLKLTPAPHNRQRRGRHLGRRVRARRPPLHPRLLPGPKHRPDPRLLRTPQDPRCGP